MQSRSCDRDRNQIGRLQFKSQNGIRFSRRQKNDRMRSTRFWQRSHKLEAGTVSQRRCDDRDVGRRRGERSTGRDSVRIRADNLQIERRGERNKLLAKVSRMIADEDDAKRHEAVGMRAWTLGRRVDAEAGRPFTGLTACYAVSPTDVGIRYAIGAMM